jgi:hypothetical protein
VSSKPAAKGSHGLSIRTAPYDRGKYGKKGNGSISTSSSSSSDMEIDEMEGMLLEKQRKRKRRKSSLQFQPKSRVFRSPSPFCEWGDSNDVTPPSLIEESGNESQLPSDIPDSGSDFEWDSFIDDGEMLPVSNYFANFQQHQAKILSSFSYKGLTDGDEFDAALEDPNDAPW